MPGRRRVLPFLALTPLLLPFPVRAERKPVAFGLMGGVGGSAFWGGDVKDFDVSIEPSTGFALGFNLPRFLGLEFDALYTYKGAVLRRRESGKPTFVDEIHFHGLEFPILAKVTAPTDGEVQPIFFAGPAFTRALTFSPFGKSSSAEYIDISSTGEVGADTAVATISTEDLRDWDYSWVFGGGVEWGLGTFQARLDLGQRTLDRTGLRDVRTVVLTVLAGFIF